jgi:hypothetical protein
MYGETHFEACKFTITPVSIERRSGPRWTPQPDTHGRLVVAGTVLSLWARVLDISQGGIRILLNRRLPIGTCFSLELRNPENNHSCVVFGRVLRAEPMEPGAFAIAGMFEREFDVSQLDVLVA